MIFGMIYKQRDIVLLPFPYSDLSQSKKRPVLILSNDSYNQKFEDVLVCVISSNQYADDYSEELSNTDLTAGILPIKSVVKVHKLFTIHQSTIIRKFGIVSPGKFDLIKKQLFNLINN